MTGDVVSRVRLADEHHYPTDVVRRARWDRLEVLLRRVRALQEPSEVYLPPALQPRAAKLERWCAQINDAICEASDDVREVWITLTGWVQAPLYSTLPAPGFVAISRPGDDEHVADYMYVRPTSRPRGRRYRHSGGGWTRSPQGRWK